jgi:hypothetical protein
LTVSFGVHVELTSEAPWANNWCSYYAIVTNTGSTPAEPFELQHEFTGPDGGQLSHGGLGAVGELAPGQQHRTDEFNVLPFVQGTHSLRVSVWQNGNRVADAVHEFQVQ